MSQDLRHRSAGVRAGFGASAKLRRVVFCYFTEDDAKIYPNGLGVS